MLSGTNFRYVTGANGTRLRVAIAGSGPLVLMIHGFPESWFSWRHQMPAIAAAGWLAARCSFCGKLIARHFDAPLSALSAKGRTIC
jgi:hypothetical protein